MLVASLPSRNNVLVIAVKNYTLQMFIIPEKNLYLWAPERLYLKTFRNLIPKFLNSIINFNET